MVGENGCEQYSGRSVVRNINASHARPHGIVPTYSSYMRRTRRRTGTRSTCCSSPFHGVPFKTGKGPKTTGGFRTAFGFVAKQQKRKSALSAYEHLIPGFHYGNDVRTGGARSGARVQLCVIRSEAKNRHPYYYNCPGAN